MTILTDYFIRNSDNIITTTLIEAGAAIVVSPTEIVIDIDGLVTITRSPTGDGVSYADGIVTLVPGNLTEDLSALADGQTYKVRIIIKTVPQPLGIVFGDGDSANQLRFVVSTKP